MAWHKVTDSPRRPGTAGTVDVELYAHSQGSAQAAAKVEQRDNRLLPTLRKRFETTGGRHSRVAWFPCRPPIELSSIADGDRRDRGPTPGFFQNRQANTPGQVQYKIKAQPAGAGRHGHFRSSLRRSQSVTPALRTVRGPESCAGRR